MILWIETVGVAGFEPTTSWSQTRRDNRTTLHPAAVITTGFEPVTVCLEGRCSIQLSYVTSIPKKIFQKCYTKGNIYEISYFVGAAGFEPATSWSQTRRDDRTTLRPEIISLC